MEDRDSAEGSLATVRRLDHDRFLTALFAPADKRGDLLALYAFNAELAGIRDLVSEPMLGEIRLQWWREAIEGIAAGTVPGHEIGVALAHVATRGAVDPGALMDLIDARAIELEEQPPAAWAAFEAYVARTSSAVMALAAGLLAGPPDEASAEAIRHAGLGYGLTGLLRALPYHASRGRYFLPLELLERHAVDPHDLLAGRMTPGLTPLVAEVAARAWDHLEAARTNRSDIPKAALPALLPASLADRALKIMTRPGFNPFTDSTDVPAYLRQLRLMMQAMRGRF